MDLFAGAHFWAYIILLLGPLWFPENYKFYLYIYFVVLLIMWLILDRCPLFFARKTKLDDSIIHLGELGVIDVENKKHECTARLIFNLAPLLVILYLGFYPMYTIIFSVINVVIFYRRYQKAKDCSDI
tara:strand:+ start:2937 stop:3320 length:384 start_codon:yes stop_codon:yes gene_type:complete